MSLVKGVARACRIKHCHEKGGTLANLGLTLPVGKRGTPFCNLEDPIDGLRGADVDITERLSIHTAGGKLCRFFHIVDHLIGDLSALVKAAVGASALKK